MAAITTASGLVYEDTVPGTGRTAQAGDLVTVHYTGWLEMAASSIQARIATIPFSFPWVAVMSSRAGTRVFRAC